MTPTSRAHLTCLCGAVQEPGSLIKEEQFPLHTDICMCNPCRQTTGGLWAIGSKLREAPKSLSRCTGYQSSPDCTRYFCRTCGSSTFVHLQSGEYFVDGGCIEQSPESKARGESWPTDLWEVDYIGYAGDSKDFRHAALMMTINGKDIPVYDQGSDGPVLQREDVVRRSQESSPHERGPSATLTAECHCGGVSLRIHRPDWDEAKHTRWMPEEGPRDKYRGSFCVCRSCRLSIGAMGLCPWTYVPPERLSTADGTPVKLGIGATNVSGLQDYVSTADEVKRSFCRTCGATFFYWAEDRPQVVDIAVGVLRAPEGMAASTWLWWRTRMSYEEENQDGRIVDALKGDAARVALF